MDNSFETEFNSFFGGNNSLYKKLGDAKARRVLNMLKQMLGPDENDKHTLRPSFDMGESGNATYDFNLFEDELGEPDEVNITEDEGTTIITKIWKDEDGNPLKTLVEAHISDDSKNPLDAIFKNGFPSDFLPTFTTNSTGFFNFLGGMVPKRERTIEELLERAVTMENYELAADVKKIVDTYPQFVEVFKQDMKKAADELDIETIKELSEMFEQRNKDIQGLIDANEALFED